MSETTPDLLVCEWRGFETAYLGPIQWVLPPLGNDARAFVPDADGERSSRFV